MSVKFAEAAFRDIADELTELAHGEQAAPIQLVGDADLLCGQIWSLLITPVK